MNSLWTGHRDRDKEQSKKDRFCFMDNGPLAEIAKYNVRRCRLCRELEAVLVIAQREVANTNSQI